MQEVGRDRPEGIDEVLTVITGHDLEGEHTYVQDDNCDCRKGECPGGIVILIGKHGLSPRDKQA